MSEQTPRREAPLDYPASPQVSRIPGAVSQPSPVRWMGPVALVISLLAAGAAGWALFKPATEVPKTSVFAGNPAAADPRADACKAVLLVAGGVARQSQTNLGPEPAAMETVAANTRLAMAGGAAYLREATPSNAPAELAEPITTLATQLQDIAQHFFVGETSANPEQAGRMAAATQTTEKLAGLCK